MRLTKEEVTAIKEAVAYYDVEAKTYLFGSRVDDKKKGGDIDLLVMSQVLGFDERRKIRLNLYEKLGEQKIDIVLSKDKSDPFTRVALAEAVELR
ncbi:MAG TPA: nucleotidyltransferase domain-containing protein [Chloroflexi bacterium]|nr:MAG: DNA polymerase III subunit beta [Anaerolineaceae bacterium 4572_5.2]HEY83853.1 nucleotidyltransferase domain-containing protein [Chloroflexota bacterium]